MLTAALFPLALDVDVLANDRSMLRMPEDGFVRLDLALY